MIWSCIDAIIPNLPLTNDTVLPLLQLAFPIATCLTVKIIPKGRVARLPVESMNAVCHAFRQKNVNDKDRD